MGTLNTAASLLCGATLNTAASLLCGANILANIRKFAKVKIDPCLGMPRGTAL